MKYIRTSKSFSLLAMIVMVFLSTSRMSAQNNDEPAQVSFLSDIAIESLQYKTSSWDYLKKNNYSIINMDLNKGVTGSDYVYLGYKTTTDPYDAITDIIVVIGEQYSGDKNKTIYYKGRRYRAANYSSNSKGGNLNRGKGGSADLYFYYTKDRPGSGISEGESCLTIPEVLFKDKQGDPNSKYAVLVDPEGGSWPNADLNKDAGGKYVFLELNKHTHANSGVVKEGINYCLCGAALQGLNDKPQLVDGYYDIRNLGQLKWFSDYVNESYDHHDACARLRENIDMSSMKEPFIPIASSDAYNFFYASTTGDADGNGWSGTFDGNGCTISNMKINTTDGAPAAFISMGKNCTVKDLNLKDVDIQNSFVRPMAGSEGMETAAGILGNVFKGATITNCQVSGTIGSKDCDVAAGIVVAPSNISLAIESCTNSANVISRNRAAGIFMVSNKPDLYVKNPDLTVNRCINFGKVTSQESSACAIAYCPMRITNCLNTNTVTSFAGNEETAKPGTFVDIEYANTNIYIADNLTHNCIELYTTPKMVITVVPENNHIVDFGEGKVRTGEMCFVLNRESTDKETVAWHQNLNTETYPTPRETSYVVYKYKRYDGADNTLVTKYTNHGMFADDVNNAPCNYEYSNVRINSLDSLTALVDLKCVVCHKTKANAVAHLVSTHPVHAPLCGSNGEIIYMYKTDEEGVMVAQSFEVAPEYGAHGNYVRNETLGVDQCERCGAVNTASFEPCKFENGVAQISKPGHLFYYSSIVTSKPCDAQLQQDIDVSTVLPYMDKQTCVIDNLENSTFDGDGHTISGFNVTTVDDGEKYGFFKTLNNSVVKNLTVEGCILAEKAMAAALLCADANNGAKIDSCITRGYVRAGHSSIAGVCAEIRNAIISSCRNYAEVTVTGNYGFNVGGILGSVASMENSIDLFRSANYGKVTGRFNVGGIVGHSYTPLFLRDCANYGAITASYSVGGLYGTIGGYPTFKEPTLSCYNLNVGKVTITDEYDSKGALCGNVGIDDGQHLEITQYYYYNAPEAVGQLSSGKILSNNVQQVSLNQLADGTVCDLLNTIVDKYFQDIDANYDKANEGEDGSGEMDFVNAHKAVWGLELIDGAYYPSPFCDKKFYKVSLNDTKMYVYENQVIDRLTIQDGYYFDSPVTFYVSNLTYDGSDITVKKNRYATLRLPFAFSDGNLKIMQYKNYDHISGKFYVKPVESGMAEAENDYIVRLGDESTDDEAPLVIEATNAEIAVSTNEFPVFSSDYPSMETGYYGTYAGKTLFGYDGFYLLSAEGDCFTIGDTDEGSQLTPFRCTLKFYDDYFDIDTEPKTVSIVEDVVPSGIEDIHDDKHETVNASKAIYNVSGQRVGKTTNLPNGIYIQNGKKILVNASKGIQ